MLARRFLLVGVLFASLGLGALAGLARAEEGPWLTDFAAAKAKAKAEKKLLLVDFTGSDWCGWCKRLVSEVFSKEEFKKEAPLKFVLVEVDFPNAKKQSDEVKKQNAELQKRYKVRGYPTIILMDADGQVIAQTGYRQGGPNSYMKHLGEFVDTHESVVKMRKELEGSKGIDRAKLLDKLVDAYANKLNNEIDELVVWDREIVALDADNKAGLRGKHEFRMLNAEIEKLKEAGKFDEVKVVAEKALALQGITAEQKQGIYMDLCELCFRQADFVGLVACLEKGSKAAPDSDQGKQFTFLAKRYKPIAEAQENVVKLKGGIEGVQGLDRAKALDKLADAQRKVALMTQGSLPPAVSTKWSQELRQWSQEIVKLDADNKAGLKKKHEFRLLLSDAEKMFRDGKQAEARATVEKALATPGLSGEQTQDAHFAGAMLHLRGGDLQKGLASLKKALDAAPNSDRAKTIKGMIAGIESQMGSEKN
jgi:thioredoxin-related protein